MITSGMMSSTTNEWSTPQVFFDELNKEFDFTLDPCATKENAKCASFFTKEQNGLVQPWTGRVFCNPPYGRVIGQWVKRACDEVTNGNAELVVMLLPARTDTRWWHDYCMRVWPHGIRLLKGRLKFGDGTNSAPFPSAVVIFGR